MEVLAVVVIEWKAFSGPMSPFTITTLTTLMIPNCCQNANADEFHPGYRSSAPARGGHVFFETLQRLHGAFQPCL